MKTSLTEAYLDSAMGQQADSILRKCVHCGFCNATCPTYQLTGDELDGPRGRIYQIKEMLEGAEPSASVMLHLDRCLTCRNCETTCPSGVQYARLLDTGRALVEQQVDRGPWQRGFRSLLRHYLQSPLFGISLAAARLLRPVLFGGLRRAVPARNPVTAAAGGRRHANRVLLVTGCVQPALQPSIDAAAVAVFDRLGITAVPTTAVACCGALDHHLGAEHAALARIRRNIDSWLPLLEDGGVQAITMTASGCGVMIRDYRHLLQHDPEYADRAERVSQAYLDPIEVVQELGDGIIPPGPGGRVAFHPPCTLQHGQRVTGAVEALLTRLGYDLVAFDEPHLCCGSAGTYSITQKSLARRLRARKLERIATARPDIIVTANIGCQTHLQAGTDIPVRHWLELISD